MLFTFWAMLKLAEMVNFFPILMKSFPVMFISHPLLVISPTLYQLSEPKPVDVGMFTACISRSEVFLR